MKIKYRKQCIVCGNWFDADHKLKEICSYECKRMRINERARESNSKKSEERKAETLDAIQICACCGNEFHFEHKRKYCSDKCYKKQMRMNYEFIHVDDDIDMDKHTFVENESERKTKKPKVKRLTEICREAKAHGMDYGEYVIWLERNKNK